MFAVPISFVIGAGLGTIAGCVADRVGKRWTGW